MSTEPKITVVCHPHEEKYVIRFRYEWDQDTHDIVATLGAAGVEDLASKLESAVREHARPTVPPPDKPERWWKIESRSKNRVAYGRGRTEREGHANSSLAHLHEGEVNISCPPLDFEPCK